MWLRASRHGASNPGVPLIATVLPKPAIAAPEIIEPIADLDAHHIFRMLVAEMALDPQPVQSPERTTMATWTDTKSKRLQAAMK